MHKNDIMLMENLAKVTLNVAENEKWSATDVSRMLATMALQAAQHMRAVDGLYCQHCGELLSNHLVSENGGHCQPAHH